MGTTFNNEGDKPKNNITISRGGDSNHIVTPTGKVNRSFAQPNPESNAEDIKPKAHASAQEEVEALSKNSTKNRTYEQGEDDSVSE